MWDKIFDINVKTAFLLFKGKICLEVKLFYNLKYLLVRQKQIF